MRSSASIAFPRRELLRGLPTWPVIVAVAALLGLAVAVPPLLFAALAFGALALVILTLLRPVWGLYLLILSVPLQDLGAVHFGSFPITLTKVMVSVVTIAWLLQVLTRQDNRLVRTPLLLPFGLLLLAILASITVATSVQDSIDATSRWVESFLAYLLVVNLVRTRRQAGFLVVCFFLGGAAEALLGLAQAATKSGPESFMVGETFSRAYGTFGMPNPYAGYLGMILPLALSFLAYLAYRTVLAHRKWLSVRFRPFESVLPFREELRHSCQFLILVVVVASLLFAALILSFSRGAWVGFAVAVIVMAVVAGRRSSIVAMFGIIAILILLFAGSSQMLPPVIGERLQSITSEIGVFDVSKVMITDQNYAVMERMAQWQAGWRMFVAHPFLGVGIGNYVVVYGAYALHPFYLTLGHAHNYYIQIAAEVGIVGLFTYLVLIVTAFWHTLKELRGLRDPFLRALVVGALGVLSAVIAHNFFENLHVLSMGIQFSAVLGLAYLAGQFARQAEKDRAGQSEPNVFSSAAVRPL